MSTETSGPALELELAVRELSGPVVTGNPRRATLGWLLGLPALLLVGGVLAAPVAYTVWISFGSYGHVLSDSDTWVALRNSLLWVLVAVGVTAGGFALAVLTRRVRWGATVLLLVLVAPMAVSALVAGIAFRQMYDPSEHRGVVSALVTAAHDALKGTAPAAGARPDSSVNGPDRLDWQPAAGGLRTAGTFQQGGVADLRVVGVTVTGTEPTSPPAAERGRISGRVRATTGALAGVPVSAWSFGELKGETVTGPGGVFQLDVGTSDAGYYLVIPEDAIAPRFTPPDWLGPNWIGLVLASAFVWAWVGFAAALFRAGLDAVPPDLRRVAQVEGVGRWRQLRTVILPLLRPVTAVVLLTVVVAAVRLFDLVLVMVPGSIQPDVDVVAVNWWRERGGRTEGESAALSVVLFAVVAVVALVGVRGLRHNPWPRRDERVENPRPRRRWGTAIAVVVALLWAYPLLSLLVTSLRAPLDAAVGKWSAPSVDSYTEVLGNGLADAMGSTALIAVTATALVLLVAVPAAHQLAWGDVPQRVVRVLVVLLTLLAVVPVQMYADPLNAVFGQFGLANSRAPLILVHAAAGVPFAVLLLRAALVAAPPHLVASARPGEVGRRAAYEHVIRYAAPATIAVAVLEFVQVWNDFVVGLLVNGATPLSVVLWGQSRHFVTSIGPVAAGAVLSAVVPVVLLLCTWRYVVRGLTGGAR
ncbi:ABC transporter permease subunit [Lentzea sp. NBRC 105346]|uniref:ABC transporter permease subunit n=1 Tax=Lentzea sp. NBRC 105346 TaxID=3032205 RepID=UPI0025522A2A|nr:ABC transporter permease subunit [Lentzea sp. NBRC 105346]